MGFFEVVGFILIFGLIVLLVPRLAFTVALGMILANQYSIPVFGIEPLPFVLTLFLMVCGFVGFIIDIAVLKNFYKP